jgi:mannose-6-phosphate isomerase
VTEPRRPAGASGSDGPASVRTAAEIALEAVLPGLLTGASASSRRVDKPWGCELVWAENDRYAGKIIVIDAGRRLSLQLHHRKDETILVLAGRMVLHLDDDAGTMTALELGPGDHARVATGRRHRFEAIEPTALIEVSSPELDDVVRLEDDHGRAGTSEP